MPNFKVNYENKLKAVLEYLGENTTQMATAKKYSAELKYAAVLDYLSGGECAPHKKMWSAYYKFLLFTLST